MYILETIGGVALVQCWCGCRFLYSLYWMRVEGEITCPCCQSKQDI